MYSFAQEYIGKPRGLPFSLIVSTSELYLASDGKSFEARRAKVRERGRTRRKRAIEDGQRERKGIEWEARGRRHVREMWVQGWMLAAAFIDRS